MSTADRLGGDCFRVDVDEASLAAAVAKGDDAVNQGEQRIVLAFADVGRV